MHYQHGRKTNLFTSNNNHIYRSIFKPIWTYAIQLWGTTSTSDIYYILEHFKSEDLRTIVDAPWYVPNTVIRRDLQSPTAKDEIRHNTSQQLAIFSETHGAPQQQTIAKTLLLYYLRFRLQVPFPQTTTGPVPISYRGGLLSTLLHVRLIPTSYNKPRTYQLQRSSTEHSFTCKSHSHMPQQA
jgi:hypothetical protein